jgi:hypothetical protein
VIPPGTGDINQCALAGRRTRNGFHMVDSMDKARRPYQGAKTAVIRSGDFITG